MEQIIIKNGIIKKLLIVIVISTMLFNYILPLKVVYADGEQTISFEEWVIKVTNALGELKWTDGAGEEHIDDFSNYDIIDFWLTVNYQGLAGARKDDTGRNALLEILDRAVNKIKSENPNLNVISAQDSLYEKICGMLEDNGKNIQITCKSDYSITKVDISKIDVSKFGMKNEEPKDDGSKPEEDDVEKISDGIYKEKNGRYYCTANIAGEVWDKDYIYGQIQEYFVLNVRLDRKINWPELFEKYGDDINKIKVYFDELGQNGKPKDEKKPTRKDLKIGITLDELREHELQSGEEIWYSDIYKEKTKKETPDLGGALLAPILSIVNFVADAIVGGLGSVMMGDGSGFLGLGILKNSKPKSNYENTVDHNVDVDSFLPFNIVSGGLGNSFKYKYPHINYTPEEIFAGKVELLSIDFITGKNADGQPIKNTSWNSIRKVISQWYQVLRMIAIIGFLSVLIYTGIRIIISSNAKDKARYREWIMNWLMGIAILFSMHYIMAFIVSINGELSNVLGTSLSGIHVIPSDNPGNAFNTNLMGLVRFMVQSENLYIEVGYEVMYIALIVFTIKFTVTYIKRVLNMAFLTLIAPIVALTYPIDKMDDGRAQGFDMWLKEYTFNALLQPMHCILYYVLVGSAANIAADNPIYGIAVLLFMTEAERILKKIFRFDKANPKTVGGLTNAFAAGAIASNVVQSVAKLQKGNVGKGGKTGSDNTQNNLLENLKPLKDGPVELNFNENLLDSNNLIEGTTANGSHTNETQAGGSSSNRPIVTGNSTRENMDTEEMPSENLPIHALKAAKERKAIGRGLQQVGKKLIRPIYDFDRSKEYNGRRLVRRLGSTAKGLGKLAVGATLGTAAAAVQAGISITDGKYTLKEGIASFAAGYAGGSKMVDGVGRAASSVAGSFKEGYYEGDQEALRKKQKRQFIDNDEVYKKYKNKYGDKAKDMQQLAADNMVPYGYTDVKEQFKIQKMADEIVKKNDKYDSYKDEKKKEYMKRAIKQARNTKEFIDSPGIKEIVHDPSKQEDYIKAEIKSRGINDENSAEAQKIKKGYENAFNSAAVWERINK